MYSRLSSAKLSSVSLYRVWNDYTVLQKDPYGTLHLIGNLSKMEQNLNRQLWESENDATQNIYLHLASFFDHQNRGVMVDAVKGWAKVEKDERRNFIFMCSTEYTDRWPPLTSWYNSVLPHGTQCSANANGKYLSGRQLLHPRTWSMNYQN